MEEVATRAYLESRLRTAATALMLRQVARCGVSAIAGAACGAGLAAMLLELLPRLLFGQGAGITGLAAAALAGACLGVVFEMRRYIRPSLQDAALALEARLNNRTDAIAAALSVREADLFFGAVVKRATHELTEAQQVPAPVLIRTRRLVLVPMIVLASAIACAAVLSTDVRATKPADADEGRSQLGGWNGFDAGGGRSAADQKAMREVLGMQETAATLNKSAATLRDASAGSPQHEDALKAAKDALEGAGKEHAGVSADDLPETVPATQPERDEIAKRLEGAAKGMNGAAAEIEAGKTATTDTGRDGEFGDPTREGELVAFPALKRSEVAAGYATSGQTPARREMASRAVAELERLSR